MNGKNVYRFINHKALVITMLALATTAWGGDSVLHAFHGGDGWGPENGVIADGAGNLYGTASFGGPNNKGVVFKLRPESNGLWKRTILHQFKAAVTARIPTLWSAMRPAIFSAQPVVAGLRHTERDHAKRVCAA